MTSRNNIKCFDFNGVNVANYLNIAILMMSIRTLFKFLLTYYNQNVQNLYFKYINIHTIYPSGA